MSAVIDTRQSFLDEHGAIVSSGRLVVYKLHTTELADIFQDADHLAPLANPIGLSSASWTSTQVYAGEDVTVELQAYQGVDEFGAPIYSTVKIFDVYATSTATPGSGGSISIVDTIPDLRDFVGMVDLQVVAVKGYSTATDAYVRKYIWSENSMAVDNGGSIISSTVSPTGRWILLFEEGRLDIRAFGCIPGATDVNSQFRAACNWAASAKVTIVIPTGIYNFASAGTFDAYCPLEVATGVKFNRGSTTSSNEATWYLLRLHNPSLSVIDTLAGINFRLTLEDTGWNHTRVPVTAWNSVTQGFDRGTAEFHLWFNAAPGTIHEFKSNCSFSAWSASTSAIPYLYPGVTVNVDHLEGKGVVSFTQTENVAHFRELRASLVGSRLSQCMANTTALIHLDKPVNLHSGFSTNAYILAEGLGTMDWDYSYAVSLLGGFGGKANFILSSGGANIGYSSLDQNFFNNPEGLVETWNASQCSGVLDMGGAETTATMTRGGTLRHGTVGGVSAANVRLEHSTVNGQVLSTYVEAYDSQILMPTANALPNLANSKMSGVTIQSANAVNCTFAVWDEVTLQNTDITSTGGAFRLKDVSCRNATFIPNASKFFYNASWKGGSVSGITFDASQMSVDGEATAYNVEIRGLIYLPNNINSVNGSTRKWAVNGHYNIQITDNEGYNTRKSMGSHFALLKFRYNQLNSNSTLAGWVIGIDTTMIFQFAKGSNAERLQVHFIQAEKAADLPVTNNQYSFFPANVYKPYPSWHIQPSAQITGDYALMRFYVGAGAKTYTGGSDGTGYLAYADPGVVNANHYFINFRLYP